MARESSVRFLYPLDRLKADLQRLADGRDGVHESAEALLERADRMEAELRQKRAEADRLARRARRGDSRVTRLRGRVGGRRRRRVRR